MNWVPLFGFFETKKDGIVFKGEWLKPSVATQAGGQSESYDEMPSLGIALSDQEVTDGMVSAAISFAEVGRISGCEIIVGIDIESKSYLAAGISGFHDAMFSIREWSATAQSSGEQPRWIPYAGGGDRRNLKPKRPYLVRVSVSGSRVDLSIDEVLVASATVPVNPRFKPQVGIWCSNHSDIVIDHIKVESGRPRAFVVMQFTEPYDQVYSEVIRSVCDDFGLQTVRADEIYGPGLIIGDVVDQIQRSKVVVADISPANPNVYFEVGYALALRKQIILLARKGTDLPFDVSAFRVLFYEDSIAGKAKIEEGLTRHLKAILGS